MTRKLNCKLRAMNCQSVFTAFFWVHLLYLQFFTTYNWIKFELFPTTTLKAEIWEDQLMLDCRLCLHVMRIKDVIVPGTYSASLSLVAD